MAIKPKPKTPAPFGDDEDDIEDEPSTNRIKIKGKEVQSPLRQSQEFQGAAAEAHERSMEYKNRAYTLGKNFIELITDKTLIENKGSIALHAENQVVSDLAKLAIDMNNDETQDEGMGSIGLLVLMFKTALSQRNRINALEYKLQKLEKNPSSVQSRDPEVVTSPQK